MKEVIEVYKELWSELNLFGKIALFPLVLTAFPFFLIIVLSMKKEGE